ncbi:hypothetical protein SLEP1_g24675 [Rubroshorea leprosula]|uniref:Uncharacterized protein n=1 Tax=Rubroshorea leprosula TaxID=152421 RepID=A0AAV5JGC4_9ROSI|nr:hypothetical protein SLEP1_g24675 [Rubroshorea leprosula]
MLPANTGESGKGHGANGWQKSGGPGNEPDSGLVLLLLQRKLPWLMMRLQGDSMDLMLTSISLAFNPTHILILRTDSHGFLQRISSPCFLLVVKSKKSQRQIENLTTKEKDVDILSEEMLQREKPQIHLNEFLQQLAIVREEKQSQTGGIGGIPTQKLSESVMDSNVSNFEELVAFREKSFNWDAPIEMNGIGADHQGADASFHVHDILEELMWPTSIWNF